MKIRFNPLEELSGVEVVLVIAIISVFLAIALPNIQRMDEDKKLRLAEEKVKQAEEVVPIENLF